MAKAYLNNIKAAGLDVEELKKLVMSLRFIAREIELGLSCASLDGCARQAFFQANGESIRLSVDVEIPIHHMLDKRRSILIRQIAERSTDILKVDPFTYGAW